MNIRKSFAKTRLPKYEAYLDACLLADGFIPDPLEYGLNKAILAPLANVASFTIYDVVTVVEKAINVLNAEIQA